jgi:hypothetical protein
MATTQEMLDAVNAAINARLTGGAVAAYSINGRNIQYIPLSELRELKKELQAQLAAEKGGARTFASFKNPQ